MRQLIVLGLIVWGGLNTLYGQSIEGMWVGHLLDLQQIKDEKLPQVYTIRMILKHDGGNRYRGIISKYWDKNYNTISSVVGMLNTEENRISFSENRFIKMHTPSNEFNDCKITTTLYAQEYNGRVSLNGKYYSIGTSSESSSVCPVGTFHLERPLKDTSSFAFLRAYLKNKQKVLPVPQKQNKVLPFYFPNVLVSSSGLSSLHSEVQYDVFKLANSQKTIEKKTLLWKEDELIIRIRSLGGSTGDTINVILDGVQLATNVMLMPQSELSIRLDFSELKDQGFNSYVHILSIVPFAWHSKTISLEMCLDNSKGNKLKSYVYEHTSMQNIHIPIQVSLK